MATNGKPSQVISDSVSGGNAGPVLFLLVVLFLIYLNRIGALQRITDTIREPVSETATGKTISDSVSNTMPTMKTPTTPTDRFGQPPSKAPLFGGITPKGSFGK